MDLLKNFLERFRHLKNPRDDREKVAELISRVVGASISPDSIEIKRNEVFLTQIPPILRTTIYINKEKILESFKSEPSLPTLSNIR